MATEPAGSKINTAAIFFPIAKACGFGAPVTADLARCGLAVTRLADAGGRVDGWLAGISRVVFWYGYRPPI